ncbi:MAG: hypothetical protein AB7D38_07920 [Sulfurimonas sp.]|uniref:hypothetical protein n=1 Tax=Sulfurimonas sp. TaxID=2022749 RepID=UPI003D0AAD22
MKHLHNNDKLEIQRLKHSKRTIKVGFILFTIISVAVIAMMFLKTVEDKKINEKANEIISNLENENKALRRDVTSKQNQISYLTRKNQELQRNRSIEQSKSRQVKPTIKQYSKPKVRTPKIQEQQYTRSGPSISKPKIYNKPKYTATKKMYQRYTAAKLVSDSKITVMSDNRLKSNMPIYGRYIKEYGITTECGKNENIYKIMNECTGVVFPLDKIYFKKSNAKNIQNHNRKTHMVECLYDYENGVMHDCSVKLIGVM